MWTIFKVFIEFVAILFLFLCFGFFGPEACGILVPWLGTEPTPPALEGEVFNHLDRQGSPYRPPTLNKADYLP